MIYPLFGLLAGIILGGVLSFDLSQEYLRFMSVALMAGLDSVFGGIRSFLEKKYDNTVFVSGFFTNTLLAVGLTYIGERLSIDLYFVAVITFGLRMFQNMAIIRRHFLKK